MAKKKPKGDPGDPVTFIRLPAHLREQVKKVAAKEDRSIASMIRVFVMEGLAGRGHSTELSAVD